MYGHLGRIRRERNSALRMSGYVVLRQATKVLKAAINNSHQFWFRPPPPFLYPKSLDERSNISGHIQCRRILIRPGVFSLAAPEAVPVFVPILLRSTSHQAKRSDTAQQGLCWEDCRA